MDWGHHLRVYGDIANTLNGGILVLERVDAVAGGLRRVPTRRGRHACAARGRQCAAAVSPVRYQSTDGLQMVDALPTRRSGGPGRSLTSTAPLAAAHDGGG